MAIAVDQFLVWFAPSEPGLSGRHGNSFYEHMYYLPPPVLYEPICGRQVPGTGIVTQQDMGAEMIAHRTMIADTSYLRHLRLLARRYLGVNMGVRVRSYLGYLLDQAQVEIELASILIFGRFNKFTKW